MQWRNREKDWYNAERRFIFASPSSQMKTKWIKLITRQKRLGVNSPIQRLVIKDQQKNKVNSSVKKSRASWATISNNGGTTKASFTNTPSRSLMFQDYSPPPDHSEVVRLPRD